MRRAAPSERLPRDRARLRARAIGHNRFRGVCSGCSVRAASPVRPVLKEGLSEKDSRLISIIQAAGWPIWPLILCSVVAVALIIERFVSLRVRQVHPPALVDEVIMVSRNGIPPSDVVDKLSSSSSLGSILAAGFRALAAEPRLPETGLRQHLEGAGREALHRLERYLNALGTIATAAPLLGLLGTVVGMIEIFGSQAPGTGGQNPQQLAHGISIALYNTAFGLIIAIPALMFHRYFRARVETYRLGMELAVERMLPHLVKLSRSGRGSGD